MKTLDDFTQEAKEMEEEPLYALFATAPCGKGVYGQPPIWGRYVLRLPEELLDDDEPDCAPQAAPVRIAWGFSYGF